MTELSSTFRQSPFRDSGFHLPTYPTMDDDSELVIPTERDLSGTVYSDPAFFRFHAQLTHANVLQYFSGSPFFEQSHNLNSRTYIGPKMETCSEMPTEKCHWTEQNVIFDESDEDSADYGSTGYQRLHSVRSHLKSRRHRPLECYSNGNTDTRFYCRRTRGYYYQVVGSPIVDPQNPQQPIWLISKKVRNPFS